MPFCTNCGKQNSESNKFCTSCGAVLNQSSKIIESGVPPNQINPVQTTAKITSQVENISKTQATTSSTPQITNFDISKWLNKNKYIIFSIVGLAILSVGVYYFYLKHDPVKDAKKIAIAYCDCGKKQNEQMTESYRKFLTNFDLYKFSGREAAHQKLTALMQSINDISQECYGANQEEISKLKERYIGNIEATEKFELAYGEQLVLCNNYTTEQSSLYNQAISKINQYMGAVEKEQVRQDSIAAVRAQLQLSASLEYAEQNLPSIERMKQDIRGKSFTLPPNELGWPGVQYDIDVNFLSFKSSGNSFQKETRSFTSNIDMATGDNRKTHCNLIGIITYTWDANTNAWVFQNIVAQEFHQIE